MSTLNYELLYHPGIPGRGEFVRLALEASRTPYLDVANADPATGYPLVQRMCIDPDATSSAPGNPPVFSPPALRVHGARPDGHALLISQTANILSFLGDRVGLVPRENPEAGWGAARWGAAGKFWVQQLALTALDWNDEVHDTHHPIASSRYYEEQREEALRKSREVREVRIPKFCGYFQRALEWNRENGGGEGRYLVGSGLTYADTTVWQVLDGLRYAFPKEMAVREKEFPALFGFYEGIKGEEAIREYLQSERRLPYSMGVFRHYPELDRPET